MAAGDYLYNAYFNGTTTIYQNTICAHTLTIADGASVTDGAGTYRLNVTATTGNHVLLGTWDMPIYFDGASASWNLTIEKVMGGTVFFNKVTTLIFTEGQLVLDPSGWANVTLMDWASSDLNAYGQFYLKGAATVNMTAASGRYALWNGSASLGIVSTVNGTMQKALTASDGMLFTINPCPLFVTSPDELEYYGGRYYYNADTNEENAGLSQSYVLICNFPTMFVVASGEVQGDVSDSDDHTFSLLVSDEYGGYTYLNWTVTVSMEHWNLRSTITVDQNGWLKVDYDFEFAGNRSLLTGVQWNFGDGNGSKDYNPIHQYERAGTYLVTVILFDELGHSGTTTREVTVGDPDADQNAAYLDYWLNARLAGAVAIVLISILAAGLYVYIADKQWGGAHRLFPIAIVAMGLLIAVLAFGGN